MEITIQSLSAAFNTILHDWLTPEELMQVNKRNSKRKNENYCATHEFCEPNEAMLQAFVLVFNREYVFFNIDIEGTKEQSYLDDAYFNHAWNLSKKNKFKI